MQRALTDVVAAFRLGLRSASGDVAQLAWASGEALAYTAWRDGYPVGAAEPVCALLDGGTRPALYLPPHCARLTL